MTTLSESTMARSRCTTVVSRLSCGSYSTSATSVGSAGRGDTQSRPSPTWGGRSEEHTSELQSRQYLVCRLLLEKKKKSILTNQDRRKSLHALTRADRTEAR